jgi:hypothetical protein
MAEASAEASAEESAEASESGSGIFHLPPDRFFGYLPPVMFFASTKRTAKTWKLSAGHPGCRRL